MPNVMAAQPNIGAALCGNYVNPFLVPRHKVWLTPARAPCCNAANIGERKTWTQSDFCSWQNFARGQAPPPPQKKKNVYIIHQSRRRPNIPLSFVDRCATSLHGCSNEAKSRNRLKFAGMPQTPGPISAVSGPKYSPYCDYV